MNEIRPEIVRGAVSLLHFCFRGLNFPASGTNYLSVHMRAAELHTLCSFMKLLWLDSAFTELVRPILWFHGARVCVGVVNLLVFHCTCGVESSRGFLKEKTNKETTTLEWS